MKWFKHYSSSFMDENLSRVIEDLGAEGYGIWWIILEAIASQMDHTDRCSVEYSAKRWGSFCGISAKKFQKVLEVLAEISSISYSKVDEKIKIECRNLLKIRDEHTSRLGSKSRVTPAQDLDLDLDLDLDKDKHHNQSSGDVFLEKEKQKQKQKQKPHLSVVEDDSRFYKMRELSALAVRYLGWSGNLSAGQAEQMRPLTEIFKKDVDHGFMVAAQANAKSIAYVIKAAGNNHKGLVNSEITTLSDEDFRRYMEAQISKEAVG